MLKKLLLTVFALVQFSTFPALSNPHNPFYTTLVADYGSTIFVGYANQESFKEHPFYIRVQQDSEFRNKINTWAKSMLADHISQNLMQYTQALASNALMLNEEQGVNLLGFIASFPRAPVPHFLLEYWTHTPLGRYDFFRIFFELKNDAENIRENAQKALPAPPEQADSLEKIVAKILTPFEDYRKLVPIPEVIDQEALEEIEVAINSKEIASAVILGKRGSGKTHLLWGAGEAFSKKGDSPVFVVNVGSLEGHKEAQNRGGVERYLEALKQFLIEHKDNPPILLVDEIQLLRGVGTAQGRSSDFFDHIKQMMTSGLVRLVGTTTLKEYNAYFSGDEALSDRLTKVYHKEPQGKELENILVNYIVSRQGMSLKNPKQLADMAAKYSQNFIVIASEPRRSANLIDKTLSRLRVKGVNAEKLTKAQLEKELQTTLVKYFGVREHMFSPSYKRKLLEGLEPYLKSVLVGQKDLIESFLIDFALHISGGKSKPMRILLAGPPGQGKTLFAKTVAKYMGGHFALIDMASVLNLEELLMKIHEAITEDPFATILLDEIEKAPLALQNSTLTMLEEGRFTLTNTLNSNSNSMAAIEVDISKALILSATNAGSEAIKIHSANNPKPRMSIGFIQQSLNDSSATANPKSSANVRAMLEGQTYSGRPALSPPFIDRMKIYVVQPAEKSEFKEILSRQVSAALKEFQSEHKVHLEVSTKAINQWINSAAQTFSVGQTSNREVERLIQDGLTGPLTQFIILNKITKKQSVLIKVSKSGEVSLGVVEKSCIKSLL